LASALSSESTSVALLDNNHTSEYIIIVIRCQIQLVCLCANLPPWADVRLRSMNLIDTH
jgi:hypothetical protein